MSKTTPEEAKALGNEYGYPVHESGDYFEFHIDRLAALIDEVRGVDVEPVATVNGNEMMRQIIWNDNVAAFDFPIGTKLYTHPAPSQPAAQDECSQLLSTAIGVILSNKNRIGYQPNSPVDKFVREAAEFLKDWPRKVQPAAPVELPVVATALLQHALKLADRLPDSEIAYTLRLYLNGLTESPDCYSDEQIIRASVQAMPHTNPDIADDLLQGHAIHTEMADILAIWKAARLQPIAALTIYLDEDAIDVGQFYRAKGFKNLPPTPTMSGAEIRACGWKKNNYQMYLIPPDGEPSIPVGDAQAIHLIDGMRFWCIPPATAGVSLNGPESTTTLVKLSDAQAAVAAGRNAS